MEKSPCGRLMTFTTTRPPRFAIVQRTSLWDTTCGVQPRLTAAADTIRSNERSAAPLAERSGE